MASRESGDSMPEEPPSSAAPAEERGPAARALMRGASSATLATVAEGGQPYASLVTPAVAEDGAVLLWLSTLSEHTRQLMHDPRCSLLFLGEPEGPNPQTTPRVTVTGLAERIEDPGLKAVWLARHPYAELYADFADFGLWRIMPMGGQMVLGFARAHRLRAADLRSAPGEGAPAATGPEPDPEGVP
ncbi:HugZ family protein [Roseomonas sp. KE2513]|uniref:HugZ family pyridoxamine 5'-phosphate oxidase n=1 Tax=Roseomonas sp. KE2513 TaxID=2479202 RepID=UPI001E3E1C7A|nr:pyridoxamine 5'-phosphate oxidase family protein [Roseomonas sp. KE2513]